MIEPSAREWARKLAPYSVPSNKRGLFEIAVTLLPYVALWALTAFVLSMGYWAGLLLLLPTSGFLLRLFLIQHDCGHGAFFTSRAANDWTGRIIGVLTFTPYFFWKFAHNMHHAGSGNLSRRGFGDINTLTVAEFAARTPFQRLLYRLYRHPLVMFGIGPAVTFLLDQRLPLGQVRNGWRPWASTMGTNFSIAFLSTILIYLVGWKLFLLMQLSTAIIAATIGVWLFFVQHQFEDMTWDHDDRWNWHEAALRGSTHYDLPQPFRWFTANIGLHHIHHLSSRIPYYHLPKVIRDFPKLREVNRINFLDSFNCVPLALWDEESRRMLSFKASGF
ncbi:MAG: fatty acid desaturase [Rhizobiales bacterium]|nr:fatty acid desaturase [Hyphomicrobiales bacterium]